MSLKTGKEVKVERKYFVSLPTEEAHHQTHLTGGMHGMAQKVHPAEKNQGTGYFTEGITDTSSVSQMLRHYITTRKKHLNSCQCKLFLSRETVTGHTIQRKMTSKIMFT